MSKRGEHLFQFKASAIAQAARDEAAYHERRFEYWQGEADRALVKVEQTIGAKVVRRSVTMGEEVDVVVDYGDAEAWAQYRRAFSKLHTHRDALEAFKVDAELYGTQDERVYELDAHDVAHFRLGGQEREE